MKNLNKTLTNLIFSAAIGFSPFSSVLANTFVEELPPVLSVTVDDDGATGNEQTEIASKVNINLASLDQLLSLPGIGRVKAAAILNYRKEVGPFKQLDDLQNIKGIGQKLFARLQDKIDL